MTTSESDTSSNKHWTGKVLFVSKKTGAEVEKAYNDLSTSTSFPISSNIFPRADSLFDAFIFYKVLR